MTQRRRPAGRAHPQRRNLARRRQGPRAGEVRSSRRRHPAGRREPGGRSRRACSANGIRTASRFSPKSAARSATKTSIEGETMRIGKGPQRSHSLRDHGAQGRSASADRARRRRRQDSRLLLPAGKGPHRSRRRQDRSRPARCWPRRRAKSSGTQDITGGLPRVTEIFEARKPKDPAVIAEIDGTVELLGEKRRGKRTIIVRSESGIEREHLVPHGKHLRVHAGDFVRAGEALVDGPLVPHDILRISGEEAVQQYLLAKFRTSTAASASKSTTSTSRSSSPRCCARCASRRSATPTCCPAA